MENKSHALAAGVFVLVAGALLAALAVWLTRDQGHYHVYEISTSEIVSGLQPQAPVRYRGVDVGKVASIGFDPEKRGNVLVRLQVDEGAPMSQATFAQLNFQGVTGLAFVQLDDGGKTADALLPNDDVPPRIPLKPSLFGKLAERGEIIIEHVEKATAQLGRLLDDSNHRRMMQAVDNLGQAGASVNQLARRLDSTVATRLDPALASIAPFTAEASQTLRSLQSTSDQVGQAAAGFGRTAQRLNEKGGPIDRLAEGTEALSAAADAFQAATLPRINQVTDETSRAMRRFSRAANGINDNPQSLIFGNGTVAPGPGEPGFAAPQGGPR